MGENHRNSEYYEPFVQDPGRHRFYSLYLPATNMVTVQGVSVTLSVGSLTTIKVRNRQICRQMWKINREGKKTRKVWQFTEFGREGLLYFLLKASPFTPEFCNKISQLKYDEILRIEGVIHAIVDCFLFSLPSIFREKEGIELMKRVIRNIFKSAIVSRGHDVPIEHWKKFSSYLWITKTKSNTMEANILSRYNLFRKLLDYRPLQELTAHSQEDLERLAMLVQTRNLPTGGSRARQKALDKFRDTVTLPPSVLPKTLEKIKRSSFRIGGTLRSFFWAEGESPTAETHISLSAAGDYITPAQSGGRGKTILDCVRKWLLEVPEQDGEILLPLGYKLTDKAGIHRWKTWGRGSDYKTPSTAVFGELRTEEEDRECVPTYDRRWGFDETLGFQIYLIALLEAKLFGVFTEDLLLNPDCPAIPAKVNTIPETGGKVRVITQTLWWNIILQQPCGHFLRKLLEKHPFSRDGLKKQNQGALVISRLEKVPLSILTDPEYMILSSDLQESTDVIQWSVARSLLSGLGSKFNLLGLTDTDPTPYSIAVQLVTSRRLFQVYDGPFLMDEYESARGIMMGEPMAKAILTLLNLACEEDAYHSIEFPDPDPEKRPVEEVPDPPVFWESWRVVSVVGDDHVALGKLPYLQNITSNHIEFGSRISLDKHAICDVVKFCEEVIRLPRQPTGDSPISLTVESFKLRYLNPFSTSSEFDEESNPIFGKGSNLFEKLRSFKSDRLKSDSFFRLVRSRFLARMAKHLPRNPYATAILHLPVGLGGIGIYRDYRDLEFVIDDVPGSVRTALVRFAQNEVNKTELSALNRFAQPKTKRGFTIVSQFAESVAKYGLVDTCVALDLPPPEEQRVSEILEQRIHSMHGMVPAGAIRDSYILELESDGWITEDYVIDIVLRGSTFSEIMLGAMPTRFKSREWWLRLYELLSALTPPDQEAPSHKTPLCEGELDLIPFDEVCWDEYPNLVGPEPMSSLDVAKAIIEKSSFRHEKLYRLVDSKSTKRVFEDGHFIDKELSFIEQVSKGLPTLSLPRLFETPYIPSVPTWAEMLDEIPSKYLVSNESPGM